MGIGAKLDPKPAKVRGPPSWKMGPGAGGEPWLSVVICSIAGIYYPPNPG